MKDERMIIDAHQHVWDLDRVGYDWLTPAFGPLYRSYSYADSLPSRRRAGVLGSVLVQAADSDEDTDWMRQVAAVEPEVLGVVGYLPLADPTGVAERLPEFTADPVMVGVRMLIHEQPDPDFILREEVQASLGLLAEAGLAFDLVSELSRHLEHAVRLAQRHPELRIVIDHLSKPPIGESDPQPWWDLMTAAARQPNVFAKVSGLYPIPLDRRRDWHADTIWPFIEHALEVFGADRLMWGSDWPVSVLAGGYDHVWDALSSVIDQLSADEAERLYGQSAREFYRLDEQRLEAAAQA